jgi:curved DNA-binding protein CbpA
MGDVSSTDHYEVLQVSRTADPLIITKAFRVLAAVYHPDNRETGDADVFRRLVEAHRLLADPVSRAAYDRQLGRSGNGHGTAAAPLPPESPARSAGDERQLRRMLLHALYTVRRSRPSNPGVSMRALVELCSCSVDEAQFSLWYLRGKKLIDSTGDGDYAITVAGVDEIEAADGVRLERSGGGVIPLPEPDAS